MANTTKNAADQAHGMVDKAKDKAHDAVDQTQGTLDKARDQASGAASYVRDQASHAAGYIGDKAEQASSTVGDQMTSLADRIRQNAPQGGTMGAAASTVADSIEKSGRYLREHDMKDMTADVTGMIKSYPVAAVLVGVGIGFLIGAASSSNRRS